MSQAKRLLDTLQYGEELTAKQIRVRFSLANPHDAVYQLREQGYPIYLNQRVDSKGRKTRKYRLGEPSRAVIAAGMRVVNFFS